MFVAMLPLKDHINIVHMCYKTLFEQTSEITKKFNNKTIANSVLSEFILKENLIENACENEEYSLSLELFKKLPLEEQTWYLTKYIFTDKEFHYENLV